MSTLLTIKQFADSQPALTASGIRWAIFNAEYNGLSKSGAIIRVGSRVLIDPDLYVAWLRTNPKLGPPKPNLRLPRPVAILGAGHE